MVATTAVFVERQNSNQSASYAQQRTSSSAAAAAASTVPSVSMKNEAPSHKVASSLLLQQLLYYNTLYSICWLLASFIGRVYARHGSDDIWYVFISFWIFTEPFRLTFGWTGNLRESVPNLFIFILLTVIPQTPAQIYLATFQKDITAFDKALGTVSVALLLAEIVVGVLALLSLLHAQAERYYLEEKQAEKEGEMTLLRSRWMAPHRGHQSQQH